MPNERLEQAYTVESSGSQQQVMCSIACAGHHYTARVLQSSMSLTGLGYQDHINGGECEGPGASTGGCNPECSTSDQDLVLDLGRHSVYGYPAIVGQRCKCPWVRGTPGHACMAT